MKFAIIVPVFNTENYLSECVESILGQTYEKYEIILVDDGSTDNSGRICDEYQKRYPDKVKVIHQVNQGLACARNLGIQYADGDILMFVDSDDFLKNRNVLSHLAVEMDGCDIVAFSWEEVVDGAEPDDGINYRFLKQLKSCYEEGKQYLNDMLKADSLTPWYSCRYVYSLDFWKKNNFQFCPGIKYEDVELIYQVILAARKVKLSPTLIAYHYRIARKGSIVNTVKASIYTDAVCVIAKNIENIQARQDCSQELKAKLSNNFSCLYYASLIQSSRITDIREQQLLWNCLEKYRWVCNYTTEPRQHLIASIIKIIGIPNTAKLLGIRRKIQIIKREAFRRE